MIYKAIDRWNSTNDISYIEHSVLSRHKYVKKVGSGKNARYFYSQDEYNRYINASRSQKQFKNDMTNQNRELGTLRASSRKRLYTKFNNKGKADERMAKAELKYRDYHNVSTPSSLHDYPSANYHSLSPTSRGKGTLKKSAIDSGIRKHSRGSDKNVKVMKRGVKALTNMFNMMGKPRKIANTITNPFAFANAVWRKTGHR